MDWLIGYVVLPLAAYGVGSVPFGLLIGRVKGIDIRTQGSGNIGATNAGRVLGRKWGYLCFFLDVAKGFGPVLGARAYYIHALNLADGQAFSVGVQWAWLAVGGCCILGHMFPVFLKFRGGKGVATSLGVVLGIWPYFTLAGVLAFLIWAAVWGIWRYVSLASIVAAVMLPVGFLILIGRVESWRVNELWPLVVFSCVMGVLVIVRHRSNISRLLAGTENRGKRSGKSNENV